MKDIVRALCIGVAGAIGEVLGFGICAMVAKGVIDNCIDKKE